jgi:hypothetical protein
MRLNSPPPKSAHHQLTFWAAFREWHEQAEIGTAGHAWRSLVRCSSPVAPCILSFMPSPTTFREYRRSTRVPLKVIITVEAGTESQICDGETIVVNLQEH